MKKVFGKVAVCAFLLGGLGGCSTATLYDVIATNFGPNCDAITSASERADCRRKSDVSYEDYKQQREKAKAQ